MRKNTCILLWFSFLVINLSISGAIFNKYAVPKISEPMFLFFQNPINIIDYAIRERMKGTDRELKAPPILWRRSIIPPAILQFMLTVLLVYRYKKSKTKKHPKYGLSTWGTETMLIQAGMSEATISAAILGMSNSSQYNEESKEGGSSYILKKVGRLFHVPNSSQAHILVIANTGGGKGTSFLIPTLLSYQESIIVLDIKRESYELTSKHRSTFSTIIYLEPTNQNSMRWNPFNEIETGTSEIDNVIDVIEIMANPAGEDKQDYWSQNAQQLLVGLLLHLLHDPHSELPISPSGLHELTLQAGKSLFKVIAETKHLPEGCHPRVKTIMQALLSKEDQELSSIISTATRFLNLYADQIIAQNTNSSDFQIDDIVNSDKAVSLYLCIPPTYQSKLKPFVRLFIELVGKQLTKSTEKKNHKLLILLDQFTSLGKLEHIQAGITYFKRYDITLAIIVPSLGQLYQIYGKETPISVNYDYTLIFSISDLQDAKNISEYIEKQNSETKSTVQQAGQENTFPKGSSANISLVRRESTQATEIMQIPFTRLILLIHGRKPVQLTKVMYFNNPSFKNKVGSIETIIKRQTPKSDAHVEMVKIARRNLKSYLIKKEFIQNIQSAPIETQRNIPEKVSA